jgi:hypothetical protein
MLLHRRAARFYSTALESRLYWSLLVNLGIRCEDAPVENGGLRGNTNRQA